MLVALFVLGKVVISSLDLQTSQTVLLVNFAQLRHAVLGWTSGLSGVLVYTSFQAYRQSLS